MLREIKSPAQLITLNYNELNSLCDELRLRILSACSANGGHLASNLGIVETTVALERVFCSPGDKIIFDVGHQCYAHKLLTGREGSFDTLRKKDGLSGFPNPSESDCDVFYAGHSGSAISSAIGLAEARKLHGCDDYTVVVAGDGAFTNGMVYEALNNCADKKLKLVIVLNDNGMSISGSVGNMPRYFSRIRSTKGYLALKNGTRSFLEHIPLFGDRLANAARRFKNFWKKILLDPVMFDDFGITYLGPVDGGNIESVETILREARRREEICLVHVLTRKGNGYAPAEENPTLYHGTGPFDPKKGYTPGPGSGLSGVFGSALCELADKDKRICAITAAMKDGTGLNAFSEKFPKRFFDVGIAEEHAVTFAGGLSKGGMRPVFAVYSTFLQRCYDQLIHDISLQGLNVVLAIDRAGLVPGDGITHQGIMDVAMLSSIPNTVIYSAETADELENMLKIAVNSNGITAVRFGKGSERQYDRSGFEDFGDFTVYNSGCTVKTVIVTYGRICSRAYEAAQLLGNNTVKIIKLKKIYPLDIDALLPYIEGAEHVYFLEEGMLSGGIGEKFTAALSQSQISSLPLCHIRAIEGYLTHATIEELEDMCGFSASSIAQEIQTFLDQS